MREERVRRNQGSKQNFFTFQIHIPFLDLPAIIEVKSRMKAVNEGKAKLLDFEKLYL